MKNIKNSKVYAAAVLLLSVMLSVSGTSNGQSSQLPTNSAASSPTPDTRASDEALRLACARAVDELVALRPVAAALKDENQTLTKLLVLERELRTGTQDLRTLDAAEKKSLRDALAAAEQVIAAVRQENAVLKKNRWGFWKKVGAVVAGIGGGVIIGAIVANE